MEDTAALLFGLSNEQLASLTGAHVTTVRRWRRGRLPLLVQRCLAYARLGELGAVSPAWAGWSLKRGTLVSPEGQQYTPGDVRASHMDRDLVRELRRQLEEATRTILSAQERRSLRAALVEAHNALAVATAATMGLVDGLTLPERQRVHEGVRRLNYAQQTGGGPP